MTIWKENHTKPFQSIHPPYSYKVFVHLGIMDVALTHFQCDIPFQRALLSVHHHRTYIIQWWH